MNSAIIVQNPHAYPANLSRLREAASVVLQQREIAPGSALTIVLTTDDDIQALNRQHRDTDAPTDVLSFSADSLPPEVADEEPPYLGDIIIAFPYARKQAEQARHALDDSLALLVVHGTLHLLGYDHATSASRATMWAAQAEALQALGIDTDIVPVLEDGDHA